jgi:D-xylose transport system ATP-binding protein
MNNKISLVPEDRKKMGLILRQTILKNISLPNLEQFATAYSINHHKELHEAERFAKFLAIKTQRCMPGQFSQRWKPAKRS